MSHHSICYLWNGKCSCVLCMLNYLLLHSFFKPVHSFDVGNSSTEVSGFSLIYCSCCNNNNNKTDSVFHNRISEFNFNKMDIATVTSPTSFRLILKP